MIAPDREQPIVSLRRRLLPTWAERRRRLPREIQKLLALAYAALAFAWFWPADYRNDFAPFLAISWVAFMLRTFAFHGGLLVLLAALAALMIRRGRTTLIAVPLVIATLGPTARQYVPRSPPATAGPPLKVMSFNLLAFNEEYEAIAAEVLAADPDVLFIQEYTPEWDAALSPHMSHTWPHSLIAPRSDCFGMALFSKLPFSSSPQIDLPLGRSETPQIHASVAHAGREIALYNVHLFPPSLSFNYVSEQRHGFADLLEMLRREQRPAIVAGDFNFTDESLMAADLRDLGFRDTHALAGYGRGSTWPNQPALRHLPGVRIDHIYVSRELTAASGAVGRGVGSDHRPIIATVGYSR